MVRVIGTRSLGVVVRNRRRRHNRRQRRRRCLTSKICYSIGDRSLRSLSDTRIGVVGDDAGCRIQSEDALTIDRHNIVRITRCCVRRIQTGCTSTRRDKTRSRRETGTTRDVREADRATREHRLRFWSRRRWSRIRHTQRDLRRGLLTQRISNYILNWLRHRASETSIWIKRDNTSGGFNPVLAIGRDQRAALRRNE